MIEANENEMKKKPWGHKVVSIDTPDDCNTEVHVLVCANLLGMRNFVTSWARLCPWFLMLLLSANPRPSRDVETVSASDSSQDGVTVIAQSPEYCPGTPDEGW